MHGLPLCIPGSLLIKMILNTSSRCHFYDFHNLDYCLVLRAKRVDLIQMGINLTSFWFGKFQEYDVNNCSWKNSWIKKCSFFLLFCFTLPAIPDSGLKLHNGEPIFRWVLSNHRCRNSRLCSKGGKKSSRKREPELHEKGMASRERFTQYFSSHWWRNHYNRIDCMDRIFQLYFISTYCLPILSSGSALK